MSYSNYLQGNEGTFIDSLAGNNANITNITCVNLDVTNFSLLGTASETIPLYTNVPLGNTFGNLVCKSERVRSLVTISGRLDCSLSLANANKTILAFFDMTNAAFPRNTPFSSVYDVIGMGVLSSDSGTNDFVIPCQITAEVGSLRIQLLISTVSITLPQGPLRLTCTFTYFQ